MKKCKQVEKKLTAYLHGELKEKTHKMVEEHLAECETCRAELEAHQATLSLLDTALEAAPAPEELTAWRALPCRVSAHRPTLADRWYNPTFRAVLVTSAVYSILFVVSMSLVVMVDVQDKHEQDVSFSPAPVTHPRMPIKKLSVAVDTNKNVKPKLRKRVELRRKVAESRPKSTAKITAVVQKVPFNEIQFPDLPTSGVGSGMSGGLGSLGYSFPEEVAFSDNTERYSQIVENSFNLVMKNPLSTFSIDVDRASYANVRRFLNNNQLPPPDAVRIEELVNYFHYNYPQPKGEDPFTVSIEAAPCPWNKAHQLALVGIHGLQVDMKDLPPNNLVFLLDVSGSMNSPSKLPLLQSAMRLLADKVRPQDRISIVVYAGAAGLVLEPTANKTQIRTAINQLRAGGSTAGGAGIELAYKVAQKNFIKGGNNRVILATDGDFNVGVSSDSALVSLIEKKRKSGVFLTVLGFGTGNYQDAKMEKLADKGNGNYAYIDNILEAKKTLITEMGGTLLAIAKDVKIQIEFNPAQVKAYRLIGYENRLLAKEDFADDAKDAGELGAGHTVTALYELIPADKQEHPFDDAFSELRYQATKLVNSDELMTLKLRYKKPFGDTSKLLVHAVKATEIQSKSPSENLQFASGVAEFGLLLRNSQYKGSATYLQVLKRARQAKGTDTEGYRSEFIRLVEKAQLLSEETSE